MQEETRNLRAYAKAISANLARGDATEHTHRPALKALMDSFQSIVATNEPKRIDAGAPDYIVSTGVSTIGYIEAKDIGENLTRIERTDQIKRYLAALPNLILTDYIEFRWYTDGQLRETARLGMIADSGIRATAESLSNVLSLLRNFLAHRVPGVGTPKELASRMGHMARIIEKLTVEAFAREEETGSLHSQYKSFKEVLLPDLTPEQFADMYTQTIAYGLFAARVENPPGTTFTRQSAAYLLPRTNPFLRKLFGHIAGVELADEIAWAVDDLAQILDDADMSEILRDFGHRTRQEDPVVHFYETFLSEYNPKMREMRGVYYTPEPVVSYIVRSVDHLLKTRFGKPLGLADPSVLILDPACGTGTFLFYVVKLIYDRMVQTGQKGSWNSYVETKLLPRLFGFELLMAPYAIAHLKLGLLLEELGYEFKSDQRLEIYLTNTLEEAVKATETLGFAGYITEEANAASEIKREKPIMVVLGNPPYSGHSANKGAWIDGLLKGKLPDGMKVPSYYEVDGKPLGEKNPKWLQDDYVKFIRFAQWRIEKTGFGILGFVSNHGYLDNPTFRGMRQQLMNAFDEICLLDLHGNTKKKEVAPDGSKDENVFDIQQGVAIGLFVKEEEAEDATSVTHGDLWGARGDKYAALNEADVSTLQDTITPNAPFYLFVPQEQELLEEFGMGWKPTDVLPVNVLGFQTHRDEFAVGFGRDSLAIRIADMADAELPDEAFRGLYPVLDSAHWKLARARQSLSRTSEWEKDIILCHYRSFDWRYCFYSSVVVDRPRKELLHHVKGRENVIIGIGRQGIAVNDPIWSLLMCSKQPVDANIFRRGGVNLFPLYLYPETEEAEKQSTLDLDTSPWPLSEKGRRPNLNPAFVDDLKAKLGMEFITDGKGDLSATFGPEDIFDYIYAVFHSPTYRARYAEFLKIDFPRVPLTSDPELFRALAAKGSELVALHLMESPALDTLITNYPVQGTDIVEKVEYQGTLRRVKINKDQYFEGIEPEVWEFHIGGYRVMQKWLKDRKGRKLTWEDQQHYQKIALALTQTLHLMAEIDAAIPAWPLG